MSEAEREAWRRVTDGMNALARAWSEAFLPKIVPVPTHPQKEHKNG